MNSVRSGFARFSNGSRSGDSHVYHWDYHNFFSMPSKSANPTLINSCYAYYYKAKKKSRGFRTVTRQRTFVLANDNKNSLIHYFLSENRYFTSVEYEKRDNRRGFSINPSLNNKFGDERAWFLPLSPPLPRTCVSSRREKPGPRLEILTPRVGVIYSCASP